jgi:Zn-dependent protease with chaperone function
MRSRRKPGSSSTSTSGCSLIAGRYFDGRSSTPTDARLELGPTQVRVHGLPEPVEFPLAAIRVSERVGNIARRISLPDGAVFETMDNDAVDSACEAAGLTRGSTAIHRLESRWRIALGSLVAVVAISFVFVRWGVPAIATWAADVMPARMDLAIGRGTLDVLDRVAFEPTRLPIARQKELQARFARMTAPLDDGHEYRLELRDGGKIGANAFALPSGIVVMTDQLVELAKNDDEIVAVLAHEIGHVRGRHALRHLLQAAGVSAIAVALLGDVSTISGILSAAPALLHAKHSREFEIEADAFARKWLIDNDVPESSFDAILCRMSEEHDESKTADEFDFFSSHPATGDRARCR